MRLAILVVLWAAATAHAEGDVDIQARVVLVGDPDHQVTPDAVFRALDGKAMDACPLPRTPVLVWMVFDKGKVASADAGGSTDKAAEACFVKAAKTATLQTKSRVVAVLELSTQPVAKIAAIAGGGGSAVATTIPPAPPPPPVSGTGSGSSSGEKYVPAPDDNNGLTADQINNVVRTNAKQLRGCYDIARRTIPELAGKFTYRFEIDKAGTVTAVQAQTVIPPERLDTCIVRVIKAMKFPTANGPSIVRYPFVFTAN